MSNSTLTRKEAELLSGAPASVVNKAIEQRLLEGSGGTGIQARDLAALTLFAGWPAFRVADKRRAARWLREAEPGAELPLAPGVVLRMTAELADVVREARRYLELRDRFLEVRPDVQGGEPVIRGTRLPIRSVAARIAAGASRGEMREDYGLNDDAINFAVMWSRANPRRGRPSGLARSTGDEPAVRAEVLARRSSAA